jgi:hypothetical protein
MLSLPQRTARSEQVWFVYYEQKKGFASRKYMQTHCKLTNT